MSTKSTPPSKKSILLRSLLRFLLGFLFAFLAILPAMAAPQAARKYEDVDAHIETYMARNHIPGVSLAIAQGDEVV